MSDQYIIVVTGRFTTADSAQACQIFERHNDFNHYWYEPVRHVENSPLPMGKARERLEKLQAEMKCSPGCLGVVPDAGFRAPQGWVSVQRCDECGGFNDDFEAALSISKKAVFFCSQCDNVDNFKVTDGPHRCTGHRWHVLVPFDDAEKAGLVKREIPGNEEIHWEAILCWDTGGWSSAFFQADNREQIEEHLMGSQFDRVVHYQLIGPDDGWNWPADDDWDAYTDLTEKKDEEHREDL